MPVFKKSKKPPADKAAPAIDASGGGAVKQLDARVGFDCYRDFFTLKNYWKTVGRKQEMASKLLLYRYFKANSDSKSRYDRLRHITVDSAECAEPAFEAIANAYLRVFDEVITNVEDTPADATAACRRLAAVGKMHRAKVPGMKFDDFQQLEEPFLYMIQEVLQDRFNDKAENLFRKFFQFCLKYILEGFNS